ncbi:MAG: radical SAM family heme chaperone HemW [Peptococcaceae bacterium]|nr:radical SAM family heme chaperone HemW [Peptococcaceae bacterium]
MPSLYVHVPFCQKKCNYCAFFSIPYTGSKTFSYLQGMEREIHMRLGEVSGKIASLFLGGGTPTVLSAEELEGLLNSLELFAFSPQAEKTVEANPGTLELKKLNIMSGYGINRISLGAQSFNDLLLNRIGRIHSAQDITRSVKLIRQAGFDNLNLDLMFGLPGQTLSDWQETLQKAVDLEPEHLSLYALTIEPGTPLACSLGEQSYEQSYSLGSAVIPDDDMQADMYELAAGYLRTQGYWHYEISNFARPGFECRHNLSYWRGEDYLGLGPGAVSCLNGMRCKNVEHIYKYCRLTQQGLKPVEDSETEILTQKELIFEYIMLGFRTAEGIDRELFARKFGRPIQDIYGEVLTHYIDKGIICSEKGRIKLNPAYYFVANSIIKDFSL